MPKLASSRQVFVFGESHRYLGLVLIYELGLLEGNLPSQHDGHFKHKHLSLLLCLDGKLGFRHLQSALEVELACSGLL